MQLQPSMRGYVYFACIFLSVPQKRGSSPRVLAGSLEHQLRGAAAEAAMISKRTVGRTHATAPTMEATEVEERGAVAATTTVYASSQMEVDVCVRKVTRPNAGHPADPAASSTLKRDLQNLK